MDTSNIKYPDHWLHLWAGCRTSRGSHCCPFCFCSYRDIDWTVDVERSPFKKVDQETADQSITSMIRASLIFILYL